MNAAHLIENGLLAHVVMEFLGYALGFRLYLWLRAKPRWNRSHAGSTVSRRC